MKLVATASLLSRLVLSTQYSSTCNDDGMLEIHIPFANGDVSDLLNADAGDCPNLRGESSDNHDYSYDADNQKSILKISIEGCNLDKDLHYSPTLRASDGRYHMATANVTIGVNDVDNDRDLIFYNAVLGAECGTKTDYTVTFDYSKTIEKHEQTGCHEDSPEGQCIVAAFETYDFTFKEYDAGFSNEITGSDPHKANNMIYLQIEAGDSFPDDKTFSVKNCKFVDKITDPLDQSISFENYTMFDATKNCKNEHIDLTVGLKDNKVQIAHRLFLLSRGDQDSYSLECEIKVCDADDTSSDCASWKNTCEGNINQFIFTACSEKKQQSEPNQNYKKVGPTLSECTAEYSTTWTSYDLKSQFYDMKIQGIQEWTVPYTGNYRVQAWGAQGGNSTIDGEILSFGGKGAYISSNHDLTAGEKINILVGHMGINSGAGSGGGGSFVVKQSDNQILNIAGGGGGSTGFGKKPSGVGGQITTYGTGPITEDGGSYVTSETNEGYGAIQADGSIGARNAPGRDGYGGGGAMGSGGAGFYDNGANGAGSGRGGIGYMKVLDGFVFSSPYTGSFGGGGTHKLSHGLYAGGGGGGYSGGAGGIRSPIAAGGGGGSYNSGSDLIAESDNRVGDGLVIISLNFSN